MPTPLLKRIYQLPSLTTPATQLAGAYQVWDVPLGPVPGGYKTYRGTPEELAKYLSTQGLLSALNSMPSLRKAVEFRTIAEKNASGYALPDSSTMEELDPLSLCVGTEIYVDSDPDGHYEYKVVYDAAGTLFVWVDGDFSQSTRGRVQAKIVPNAAGSSTLLTGTYIVQPSDVTSPASAITIAVPGALVFGSVSIEGPGGQGNPLVYGTGYTSQPDTLILGAGISPPVQAGEIVHYSYLPGGVQAAGVTPAQLEEVRATVKRAATRTTGGPFVLADAGCLVPCAASAALTVPAGVFPDGTVLEAVALGAFVVAVVAGMGVTIVQAERQTDGRAGSSLVLKNIGGDTWLCQGGV